MKTKELRPKSEIELKRTLAEDREKLRQLRFDIHLKQSKNVREIRKIKKEIARLITLLKEK
ncbi:MAG: 50S ribosomal protein L29 [Patescibacteria group bacterium]|nr:50S ribosomal protein L29 [Patescibacteria group bacterium]MDD5121047.1 50S ribosomal protein L29 [Patescibacteria group bacterium]MDD5221591.1 50S ribosomal protein L29 [Patescibacteria group bacterium]MDD5396034.1 50S ribosomal protein L29 [Patescibacteria group bacterium]